MAGITNDPDAWKKVQAGGMHNSEEAKRMMRQSVLARSCSSHPFGPVEGCAGCSLDALTPPRITRLGQGIVRRRDGHHGYACATHGVSWVNIRWSGPGAPERVWCAHCEADAAEGRDARLEAALKATTTAVWQLIQVRHQETDPGWRDALTNALRDLVKEARRR